MAGVDSITVTPFDKQYKTPDDFSERIARNPQAPDQEITIPASKAPVFKAGKSLKEAVNK